MVGRSFSIVLYALLAASAGLTLWLRGAGSPGPVWVEQLGLGLFLLFAMGFSLYRLWLVRAGRYPTGKAFFQIGAVLLFAGLMASSLRRTAVGDGLEPLFRHADPRVRAVAVELARHRPEAIQYGPALVRALSDGSPAVREEAHRSLVSLVGEDLGRAEAADAWRARFHP